MWPGVEGDGLRKGGDEEAFGAAGDERQRQVGIAGGEMSELGEEDGTDTAGTWKRVRMLVNQLKEHI